MARAAGGAALPHVGLSRRAVRFHRRGCCASLLHVLQRLAELGIWSARHSGRDSGVSDLFIFATRPSASKILKSQPQRSLRNAEKKRHIFSTDCSRLSPAHFRVFSLFLPTTSGASSTTPVQRPFWARSPKGRGFGYLRSRAVDTFTPCPISRIFKAPSPGTLPTGTQWSEKAWRRLTADFN